MRSIPAVRQAIARGRENARNQRADLRVQGRDAQFPEGRSHGNNPFPTEGQKTHKEKLHAVEGAAIRENAMFAIVFVKNHILDSRMQADGPIREFSRAFPGMPVVLMAQDSRGHPSYYSRRDIAQFMARVPLHSPWKRFTLN